MTNRTHSVGDPSGSYYEYLRQTGANTPLRLRLIGKWTENDYSMERITYDKAWVDRRFWTADRRKSILLPAAYADPDAWYTIDSREGTAPNYSTLVANLAADWRNTDLSVGLLLSPEGRESVEMVGDTLLRFANSARSLKRGDFTGFIRNLGSLPRSARAKSARAFEQGDLSGAFLSAHLGWSPMISDIEAGLNIQPPREVSQPVKSSKSWDGHYIRATWLPAGATLKTKSIHVSQLVARVKEQPSFPERFGLANSALVAWNLVPLSFVADYFLPIGDTIDALEFIASGRVDKVWFKQYHQLDWTIDVPPGGLRYSKNGVSYYNIVPYSWSVKARKSSRVRQQLSMMQCMDWKLSLPKSLMRLSTLAALTHQSVLSLSKR